MNPSSPEATGTSEDDLPWSTLKPQKYLLTDLDWKPMVFLCLQVLCLHIVWSQVQGLEGVACRQLI